MKLRIIAASVVVTLIVAVGIWLAAGPDGPKGTTEGTGMRGEAVSSDRAVIVPSPSTQRGAQGKSRAVAQTPGPIVRPATAEPYGLPVSTAASSTKSAIPSGGTPPNVAAGMVAQANPPRSPDHASAAIDVDQVGLMLRDYRTRMGENPVGTNAEIMKAVMGGNSAKAMLGPPEGQSINDKGELVDRWGTPYFFHQLSAQQMEIRSAGPDKTMWTDDDVLPR